jgi:hypothetical protein
MGECVDVPADIGNDPTCRENIVLSEDLNDS